jgi:hypothetical protein
MAHYRSWNIGIGAGIRYDIAIFALFTVMAVIAVIMML